MHKLILPNLTWLLWVVGWHRILRALHSAHMNQCLQR
jgi:hypothetical protein